MARPKGPGAGGRPRRTEAPWDGAKGLSGPGLARGLELIPAGAIRGGHEGRTARRLPASWEYGEDVRGRRDCRRTPRRGGLACALVQLGVDLPDGVLQP